MRKVLVAISILLLLNSCGREEGGKGGRLQVVATITPLAYFVREVGGDRISVEVLLPPGASPHTYELSPSQMRKISKADLIVMNGVGLELWMEKAFKEGIRGLVVNASVGIEVLEKAGHPDHPFGNPHIWLDPAKAALQVRNIRDGLMKVDPGNRAEYYKRAEELIRRLEELDSEISSAVKGFKRRSFVSLHPAWSYFARRYGLNQIASIERTPGREPSPLELAKIVERMRRTGTDIIFAEPQLPRKVADVLAREAKAKVVVLDPLGSTVPGGSYFEMMRKNLAIMASVMK
jgi:zinc transport system substrate-binding protein